MAYILIEKENKSNTLGDGTSV